MNYAFLFYHLLPQGDIWPKEPGDSPVWDALISALSLEPQRIEDDAASIPAIWTDIPDLWLEDFERLLSLSRGTLSNSDRRAQINAKLSSNAGITLADMQAIATAYGATVTHHQYPLFLMGVGAMGDPLRGEQWAATMTVTYTGPQNIAFETVFLASAPPNNSVVFVVV